MSLEKIKKSIKTYNKYRKNLVKAEILEKDQNRFKVEFQGTFHHSCCMDEYFIDLIYELQNQGLRAKLLSFNQIDSDRYIAEYKIK